jgi:hypothetical protein
VSTHGAVWVADTGNNRLLRWTAGQNGGNADAVLGQADFSGRSPATSARDLARLASPNALASDGTHIYALERDLGRVTTFTVTAPSGSSAVVSYGALGGLGLSSPAGLAVERTPLFTSRMIVGDTGANRIVVVGSVSRLQ